MYSVRLIRPQNILYMPTPNLSEHWRDELDHDLPDLPSPKAWETLEARLAEHKAAQRNTNITRRSTLRGQWTRQLWIAVAICLVLLLLAAVSIIALSAAKH